jgi:hypothetical protein
MQKAKAILATVETRHPAIIRCLPALTRRFTTRHFGRATGTTSDAKAKTSAICPSSQRYSAARLRHRAHQRKCSV